jgi:hypothetical protein
VWQRSVCAPEQVRQVVGRCGHVPVYRHVLTAKPGEVGTALCWPRQAAPTATSAQARGGRAVAATGLPAPNRAAPLPSCRAHCWQRTSRARAAAAHAVCHCLKAINPFSWAPGHALAVQLVLQKLHQPNSSVPFAPPHSTASIFCPVVPNGMKLPIHES